MIPKRNGLLIPALILICLGSGAWSQTTRPAPPAETPEMQEARKAIAKAVAAAMQELSSSSSPRREAAHQTLISLSEAVLTEIVSQSKLTDAEQVARMAELFAALGASARQGQMMLGLTPEQRKIVAAFAQAEPKLFNTIFGAGAGPAAKAAARLAEIEKPGADLVLAWATGHEQWEVRLAAIQSAANVEKPQPALKDAVYKRLELTDKEMELVDAAEVDTAAGVRDQTDRMERGAAVMTLVSMKDGRVLPTLLKALLANDSSLLGDLSGNDQGNPVDLVLSLKDKRTVVTLMDHVKDTQEITSFEGPDNKKITVLRGDAAMLMIILQTDQKVADYGFYVLPNTDALDPSQCGFDKVAKRREAQKKLREWWDKNKKDYEGVQKLPLGIARDDESDSGARPNVPAFLPKLGAN
jgi:hypothetical protein